MSELMGRFREVHVTLEREATVPQQAPREWLQVRTVGNVLTFVDTQFDERSVSEQIRSRIAGVKEMVWQPMGLRNVFTTLARAARDGRA
jgi:hypothetical protein